jgi:hypothetical protein
MTVGELNEFMYNHGFCNTNNNEDLPKKYVADLVESAFREAREKAIDEFCEIVLNELSECGTEIQMEDGILYDILTVDGAIDIVSEIAERIKNGEIN